MPDFLPYTRANLDHVLHMIDKAVYTVVAPLAVRAWRTTEPLPYSSRTAGEPLVLQPGDRWGQLFDCAWFHFTGQVPETAAGMPAALLIDVSGELCVVDAQGVPARGLTTAASVYDYSLGMPGKRILPLWDCARGGEAVDVWADAGCNDLFGHHPDGGMLKEASIVVINEEARALYYDFEVLLDFYKVLPPESPRAQQVLNALNEAAWKFVTAQGIEDLRAARKPLQAQLAKRNGDPSLRISAIGHAHMDLAWLWPLRETKRKGARTFATALANMERYPDYHFGASQPQLFQWMKEDYPELYEKIKQRVREGRLEPQGAMWVEADTNVSGGEALVRQVLQGKKFFQEEFGVEIRHLWLPDVFGYSAALPQILKKSGVDTFMTQKMSWNLVNTFPHHSFTWQGLDGTGVMAHMLPEETYNSPALPRAVAKIEANYHEKGFSERCLMLFGIGDGGGGPGEEHIERITRIRDLAGLSPVTQEPAARFFEEWAKDAGRFPTWVGELYLERHTGTLTTEARNKWYNRRMEQSLRGLEWMACFAGGAYPAQALQTIWREVLLYQFHDILPGSSIKRVYDESLARYRDLFEEVQGRICEYEERIAAQVDTAGMQAPVVLFNSLSWPREEWVQAGGRWQRVVVPSLGYRAVDAADGSVHSPAALHAGPELLENDRLRVTFDPLDGSILSIFDKDLSREVIPTGQRANRLEVFQDPGDAWDFPLDYANQTPRSMCLVTTRAEVDGPRASLVQVYRFGHSELVQEIVLLEGSRRIDFYSHLHWREPATMLRAAFPVDVHAEEAAFEVQYGHVRRPTHRNTTWDLAKDEVPAQKWVDLSQRDYGVALLNDSKYGHKIKGNTIEINLLRSTPYPGYNPQKDAVVSHGEAHPGYTDQADHVFSYALFPHPGDLVSGGVVQAGYEFNLPLRLVEVVPQPGPLPSESAFLRVDAPNVVVEAVKQAEDGDGVIVRLYETSHASARAALTFARDLASAEETDLLETPLRPLAVHANQVEIEFKPFEIKTVRVRI